MKRRQAIREQLRVAGLRATQPRLLVLGYLEEAGRPVAHADVAEALAGAGLDRATIYRNLVDLTEAGLARRSDLGDHVWRFELASEHARDESAHAHFVCTSCGAIECLPEGAVEIKPRRGGLRALRRAFEIKLSGVCDACV